MPNPADLPLELFLEVLHFALPKYYTDPQRLCSLALLGRKWHAALLGRIYNEWTYNGARQSFMTLWKFVRTLRNNTSIAAIVTTLNIGNYGFYPRAVAGGPKVQLPANERWIHSAIHDAGLGNLEDTVLQSLSRRDRRPLMVILLTSVPNLSALYGHVPQYDPLMATFVKSTLDSEATGNSVRPLGKVKELVLFFEIPVVVNKNDDADNEVHEESSDEDYRNITSDPKIDYVWPVFYLPCLRTLSLFDIDPTDAEMFLGQHDAISHVETLVIGCFHTVFTVQDIQAFLTRIERLKSISLNLHTDCFESEISNPELWDCLQKHKDSLEVIDIFRNGDTFGHKGGWFGLLREFKKLRHLYVQFDTILGGCCDSPMAPFRLRDTLPSTIQKLTLYQNDDHGFSIINLHSHLRELLGG
ncbi:uncharacterized protein PGRI_037870 [Penicillium griseofulvum]|uniref:F-box domain-containing protein n=1 Tax=Penicillium patulum TaxID=5078 RepID=A0A135LDI9_PENPA|nr:uncharacterized protein PGRI_037870 [Penicillium griseofulvum]KXG47041.1 hypothetical protein PGRI_037870 [Penicillium griseofulvum]